MHLNARCLSDRYRFNGPGCLKRRQINGANAAGTESRPVSWNCTAVPVWEIRNRIRSPVSSSSAPPAMHRCMTGPFLNGNNASWWRPGRLRRNRGFGRFLARSHISLRIHQIPRSFSHRPSRHPEWTSSSTEHKKKGRYQGILFESRSAERSAPSTRSAPNPVRVTTGERAAWTWSDCPGARVTGEE